MRPANLLFLFSDEQDGRYLGAAGHGLVQTPNLDRLAARGTRFTDAYTTSPICVPARASVATGRWAHETRCWDNALAWRGEPRGWGHAMLDAGLRVESIGKLHFANAEDPTGFSAQHLPMHLDGGVGQVWGSIRDPLPSSSRRSPIFDELGAGESAYNRYDSSVAQAAADWLRQAASRPGDTPWALQVGFVAPHFPLVVPQRFLDLYPPHLMPPIRLDPRRGYRRHPWVEAYVRHSDHDAALGTDERRRLAMACYRALVTFLDEQVGLVLDALEVTGLADTTRVVFASDHGDNQGARGLWNKCMLYRESVHVPMIVAGPEVPQGTVRQTPVSLVDLAPTFLQGAGLEAPAGWSGQSLFDLASAANDPSRAAFSEYHAIGSPSAAYMLRLGRFKYHHYVGYPPELFDILSDPDEAHDLADDARYGRALVDMEAALRSRIDPEETDRRAKDDQNALIARFGGPEKALGIGPKGATPAPILASAP